MRKQDKLSLRSLRRLITSCCVLMTLSTLTQASSACDDEEEVFDYLKGLRYRNETENGQMQYASMAGGMEIFIDGAGFDFLANLNTVLFSSDTTECLTMAGTPLDLDDAIQSAPSLGRLAYTVPSLPDLFGGVTMESFRNHYVIDSDEAIRFSIKVQNNANNAFMPCASNNSNKCRVQYRKRYTPMLHDISPSNVYLDQNLDFYMNPQASNYNRVMRDDADPVDWIKFGGTRNNFEGLFDSEWRMSGYRVSALPTYSGDQHPGNSVPEIRFRVGNAYLRESAKHCNFAGDDCWYVKTHPKIDSISKTTGFNTGGQELTITGWGLKGATLADTQVTVDGIACTVTSVTMEKVKCVTGTASANSVSGISQPGNPGLTQYIRDATHWDSRTDGTALNDTKLLTAFEHRNGFFDSQSGHDLGWFKAPATGNYRFMISCDDVCKLFLNTTHPWDSSNPVDTLSADITTIAERHSWTNWRQYFIENVEGSTTQHKSNWTALTEGQYYKIEGFHGEYGGGDHFTVSVEYEMANSTGYHHANKEIQMLEIAPDQNFEIFNITVTGSAGEDIAIQFINPLYDGSNGSTLQWLSNTFSDDASAGVVQNRLWGYFSSIWGSGIEVTKTMFDASDVETTTSSESVKHIYSVRVKKLIDQASFSSASVIGTVTSTISIASIQSSSTPLGGSFKITCPDENGNLWSTNDFNYNHWIEGLDFNTQLYIPHAQFKIYMMSGEYYDYRENGFRLAIIWQDYHGNPPDCYFESSTDTPMTGDNVTFNTSILREYGKNLMFEPVPLEFLYSDVNQPQVSIKVNGIDGVCPAFNCGYLYGDPTGEITAQTVSGTSVTVTGTSLPTTSVSVSVANSVCGTVTASTTEITCTLGAAAAAGSWDIKVADANGYTPKGTTVAQVSVPLSVTGISPNTGLNQLGGDTLTITGTGFDQILDNTSVVFSDSTVCTVMTTSATQITCFIEGFDQTTLNTSSAYTVTVTVNSVVDSTQSVQLLTTKQNGLSISPNSVSPVLATNLTVTLDSGYPETLNAADFTAHLIDATNSTNTRALYVVSVDDSTKTIVIKFPGADSGDYLVQVESSSVGRIDKSALTLEVKAKVTGFSPNTSSYLGGQLITITGENFSTDPLDNPVRVGTDWCYVQTTSASQITCRIAERSTATAASAAELIVFLRTSEEAATDVARTFNFEAPVGNITSMTNVFDEAEMAHIFHVTGTGFDTSDLTATTLYIDDYAQTTLNVTANSTSGEIDAYFKVINANDKYSRNVRLRMADGLPSQYINFTTATMEPVLLGISPSTGSSGGTLITVTGSGFGMTNTTSVTLINGSNVDICETVTMTGYGTFTCLTKQMEITTNSNIRIYYGTTKYSCGLTDNTNCRYEQQNSSSPSVTSISLATTTTIDIVGTDFPTSGKDVVVIISGVTSTSGVINSATSMTVTFANGVPVSTAGATPSIRFVPTTGGRRRMLTTVSNSDEQLIAYTDSTLTNALSVTASTDSLSCSFQGGCPYTVTANGLTSTITGDSTSYIEVCGRECVLDTTTSTSTAATCTLPYVSTAYSASEYSIVQSGTLHDGTWTGTASDTELAKLIDEVNTYDMEDSTATDCYFQIQYKPDHVGVLDEVKFFINQLTDKTPFNGNLKFQGSDDGTTFTDLFTVDLSVHEGWNTYDFETNKPSYNIYRFQGTQSGSCRIGEVKLDGIESINSDATSYSCTPKLYLAGTDSAVTLNSVTFSSAQTPVMTGMSTRFISVLGNESITITGTNFSASATTTVMIDNRECTSVTTTTTSITCTTADKPYVPDTPVLLITIDGMGYVATQGKVFRYVQRWSEAQTWGYDLQPQEGEFVNIPMGFHLLVDVDSTPVLSAVNVEGSLLFPPDADPNHQRTFASHYILVKGGYMEVGTEENRYTSKLTITMHSSKYDPNLPIFGNKVIGVNYGELELHGVERPVTWTDLYTTADIGATSITLNTVASGTTLDWAVGEEIVIASTDFSGRNAEQRTIATITNTDTNPVITFTEPLEYKHYAGVQTYGDDFIEMRAEVGLLTRNVKYQGDPETSAENQYGAVIIMHSPGDETTAARIDSIELYNVGQAFILGSYPIHFHMIGTVHSSYIRNNAIHHTFNRAVTIHGIHYLRVQNNVAYHTMGHTIFIEDAIETKNLIENNLIVDVRRSWSLLNTDQTPASIWITNPDNIIRGNHAAGSDRYSYWYDTQVTAIGPSFDENICPENTKLGEFSNNVAHSNGRYGLRIFHNLIPRTYPCEPMVYNSTDPSNPYPDNPPIMANFYNLTSYKNGRNGAIAERVGAVQFHNFKTADNLLAGIEFSLTEDIIDGYAKIVGGLVIGKTENTSEELDVASPHGIITPRTEGFRIEGTKFYNYDWNDAAALGTCSHCFHPAATDSGARTIRVQDLFFDTTVAKRIMYQYPERAIFSDLTGELTGLGANTWAVPYWPHLDQPECTANNDTYNGLICASSVEVRRVAFWGYTPDHFYGMEMKIAQFEAADEAAMQANGTLEAYLDDNDNYSQVIFKKNLDPSFGWAIPFVTNHRYRVHWRQGLDFERMKMMVSENWAAADHNVLINMNFTEQREVLNVTTNYGAGDLIANATLTSKAEADWQTADNIVWNDTETRQFEFVVNGKNASKTEIQFDGHQCFFGACQLGSIDEFGLEAWERDWSDPANWESGALPVEGDDVEIKSGKNFFLDLEETPIFNSLTINGRLTFKTGGNRHLRAKQIFVRAGQLFIGSENSPFNKEAKITLHGRMDDPTLVLGGTISAGNKVLATVGTVAMYGKSRSAKSRLTATALAGATTITVETGLDWAAGDQLHIAPTAIQFDHSDYATITAYNSGTGEVTLDSALSYYHWGASASTATDYDDVDMRAEVTMLTRNVQILGEDVDGWGGQLLVSDYYEADGTIRRGSLLMDNVMMYNCSHLDTYHAAIRFEGGLMGESKITNTVVHGSMGWGLSIYKSWNVIVEDSFFIGSAAIGVRIDEARNVTFNRNFVSDVKPRNWSAGDGVLDKEACVAVCSYDRNGPSPCTDVSVTNNIAAGCKFSGFIAPGYDCDVTTSTSFKDNIAHSIKGTGADIYPDGQNGNNHGTCYELSHFKAYKTEQQCVATHYTTVEMRAHDITCIDNQLGVNLQTAGEGDSQVIKFSNSKIYGETAAQDCPADHDCHCADKMGLMLFGNNVGGKSLHIPDASPRPIYKVKSYGSYGGVAQIDNVTFKNFNTGAQTACQSRQSIFARNPYASDKIPMHYLTNIVFEDVDTASMAFFDDPPSKWAIIKDCGEFPCTAPNNILLSFTSTTYSGTTKPGQEYADFQIIPDDPNIGGKVGQAWATCEARTEWQGYQCQDRSIGMLVFESLDSDTMDRSIQPIHILNDATGFNNTLNSMMDHVWDGFYTGQTRMSRFPGLLSTDLDYTLEISGTPPKKMRFKLEADQSGTKIKIPYPVAGSVTVYANDVKQSYTEWDETIGAPAVLTNTACGENRFVGVQNFLEFYITPNCAIKIEPRDAIMTKVRMEWTLSEFYSNGGTTRFVDRMAASLGIASHRIKTLAVYSGSVVVDFVVEADDTVEETYEEASASLAAIQSVLVQKANDGTMDLGAPVLEITAEVQMAQEAPAAVPTGAISSLSGVFLMLAALTVSLMTF